MSDVRRTAAELAEDLASGATTSVELTQACLDRIAAVDTDVHAFLHVDRDGALEQARAADAKEHFAAARTLLLTLGASAAAARIDAVAEFPEALEGLSPREREVARLVSRGRTNQQIAEELIVSIKTVEFHVSRILRKLSLTSRRQLFDMSELSRMT